MGSNGDRQSEDNTIQTTVRARNHSQPQHISEEPVDDCPLTTSPATVTMSTEFLWTNFKQFNRTAEYILLKRGTLVKSLHATVALSIIVSSVVPLIRLQFVETEGSEFLVHHLRYITWLFSLWVAALQVIYFNIYFAIDILNIYSKQYPRLVPIVSLLHHVASYFLFTFVFPLSLLVSTMFWTFYFWKRDVMYPEIVDEIVPPAINHVCHTMPPIFTVIYMFISNKSEPSKMKALAGLLTFLSIYAAGLMTIKQRDGKWVYSVLETLSPIQLKLVFTYCIVGPVCFIFLGYHVNNKIRVYRKKMKDLTFQYS